MLSGSFAYSSAKGSVTSSENTVPVGSLNNSFSRLIYSRRAFISSALSVLVLPLSATNCLSVESKSAELRIIFPVY